MSSRPFLVVVAVVAASGCGGDPAPAGDPIEPRLSVIESKIFARSCTFSSCHGALTPKEGLSLMAGASYDLLVGQPSKQMPARMRVVAGDPAASYLFEKISAAKPTMGERMPQGQPALEPAAVTAIRQWIEMGAPRE